MVLNLSEMTCCVLPHLYSESMHEAIEKILLANVAILSFKKCFEAHSKRFAPSKSIRWSLSRPFFLPNSPSHSFEAKASERVCK